jgi:hypothetical protein
MVYVIQFAALMLVERSRWRESLILVSYLRYGVSFSLLGIN